MLYRPYLMENRNGLLVDAGLRKTEYRGLEKSPAGLTLAAAAYNLIRLPKLMAAT